MWVESATYPDTLHFHEANILADELLLFYRNDVKKGAVIMSEVLSRVLHVELGQTQSVITGGDAWMIQVTRYLHDLGFDQASIVVRGSAHLYQSRSAKGTFHEVDRLGGTSKFSAFRSYVRRAQSASEYLTTALQFGPDVLITHSESLPNIRLAYLLKTRMPSIKWISIVHMKAPSIIRGYEGEYTHTYHIPSAGSIFLSLQQRLFVSVARTRAAMLLTPHADLERWVSKFGMSERTVLLRHYGEGPEPNGRQDDDGEVMSSREPRTAVWIGRSHPQKRVGDAIRAWRLVVNKFPDAILHICGIQPDDQETSDQIKHNSLQENIFLLGYVNVQERSTLLSKVQFLLITSVYESYALVIAEALAFGTPVLGYWLPPYEIHYTKGFLKADIGSITHLSDNIIKFFSDNTLAHELAKQANAISTEFNIYTQKNPFIQLMKRLNGTTN